MPLRIPIVSKFDPSGVNAAQTSLDRLSSFSKTAGTLLAGAFVAASVAAGAFAISSLRAADESFKVGKALEQAAKNAGTFGNTDADIKKATDALKDHAQQLGELIGVDDEVLLSIEKTWMAVPTLANLGTKGIEHLAEVAANVAAGTGKDVETTIGLAFIKIAGDSETAMSKLTRAGVVFSDEQKNVYQSLLDTGDEIGAQQYLIDQLDAKYAGMAEAAASPLDRIDQMFQNMQETIGEKLMPTLDNLAPKIQEFINGLVKDPTFTTFLADMVQEFKAMAPDIKEIVPKLLDFAKIALPAMLAVLPGIVGFLGLFNDSIGTSNQSMKDLKKFLEAIFTPLQILITFLGGVIDVAKEMWARLGDGKILLDIILGPIFSTKDAIDALGTSIQRVNTWWRELWGLQQSQPVGRVNFGTSDGNGGLKLAKGGIVMPRPGGTMATIGEGGSAEAVIPLDKLGTIMGGGGGSTYVVNVNGGLNTSAEIGRAVVDAIKKFERTSGPVFASA